MKHHIVIYLLGCAMLCPAILYAQDPNYVDNLDIDDSTLDVLSPPVILGPLYGCLGMSDATTVGVTGFLPDSELRLRLNGVEVAALVVDGTQAEVALESPTPLVPGDKVQVRQIDQNGRISPWSREVTVRDVLEAGQLPRPSVQPTPLYECGRLVGSLGHLPGSEFEVVVNGGSPLTGRAPSSNPYHKFVPSLALGDEARTKYTFCAQASPQSHAEVVQSEPSPMPAPFVDQDKLYPGQKLVLVNKTLPGSLVEVIVNNSTAGGGFTATPNTFIRLGTELQPGDDVTAIQTLCTPSPAEAEVPVRSCGQLLPPVMENPELGARHVNLSQVVPGATIEVFGGFSPPYKKIGEGSGKTVGLIEPIGWEYKLFVRQTLGNCTSSQFYTPNSRARCQTSRVVEETSTLASFLVGEMNYLLPSSINVGDYPGPTRVEAHVKYPVTSPGSTTLPAYGGNFPVVFMMHGNHPTFVNAKGEKDCHQPATKLTATQRMTEILSYRGFDYMMEELARQGFIAVSINANDLNCADDDGFAGIGDNFFDERAELFTAHINHWKTLIQDQTSIFHDRVDLTNVSLLGHSRGADAALIAEDLVINLNDPLIQIRNLIFIASSNRFIGSVAESNLLVMLGSHDMDLRTKPSFSVYDDYEVVPKGRLKVQKYIYEANHNYFNSQWPDEAGQPVPPGSRFASGPTRMSETRQREIATSLVTSFLQFTVHGRQIYRKVLSGDRTLASIAGSDIYTSYREGNQLLVDLHEDSDPDLNDLGLDVIPFGFDSFVLESLRLANGIFLLHSIQNRGYLAQWSDNAEFHSNVDRDLSQYNYLSVDVAQTNDDSNSQSGQVFLPTSIGMGLVDSSQHGTNLSSIYVEEIPYPYGRQSSDEYPVISSVMNTIRMPIRCLEAVATSPSFNTGSIDYIRLNTDSRDQGQLAFDNLSLAY